MYGTRKSSLRPQQPNSMERKLNTSNKSPIGNTSRELHSKYAQFAYSSDGNEPNVLKSMPNSKRNNGPRMSTLLNELDDLMLDMTPVRTVLPSSKSEADLLHIQKLEKAQLEIITRQQQENAKLSAKLASPKLASEWDKLDMELDKMVQHINAKKETGHSKALSESTESKTLYQNSVLDDIDEPVPTAVPLPNGNWASKPARKSAQLLNVETALSRLGDTMLSERDIGVIPLDNPPPNNTYAMRYIVELAISETTNYRVFTENIYDRIKRDQENCKAELGKLIGEFKQLGSDENTIVKIFHALTRFHVFDQSIHKHQAAALRWQVIAERNGDGPAKSQLELYTQTKSADPATPYELKSILKTTPSPSPYPNYELHRNNAQGAALKEHIVQTPISAYMMSATKPNFGRRSSESSDISMKLASAEGRIRELEQTISAQSATITDLTNNQISKQEDLDFAAKNIASLKQSLEQELLLREETEREKRDLSEELEDAQSKLEVVRKKLDAHLESAKDTVTSNDHNTQVKQLTRQFNLEKEKLLEEHKERERQLEMALNTELVAKQELSRTNEALQSQAEAAKSLEQVHTTQLNDQESRLHSEHQKEIVDILQKHTQDRLSLETLHREELLAETRKLELERTKRMDLQTAITESNSENEALKLENEKLQLSLQDFEKQVSKYKGLASDTAALEKELQDAISSRDASKRDYERRIGHLERDLQDQSQKNEALSKKNEALEQELHNHSSTSESHVKGEEHEKTLQELSALKQRYHLLRDDFENQSAREQTLQTELDGILKEFDRISRNAADSDDRAQTLQRKLGNSQERVKSLEAKLQDASLSNISSNNDSSLMRKEFRTMLQDVRQDYERQLEQEVAEKNKYEMELRSFKRERDMELYKKINVGIQTSVLYTGSSGF